MPVQVDVPDEKVEHLNKKAEKELLTVVTQYALDVLQEAERLEASVRTSGKDPEVTSSLISDANLLLRRGYRKATKKRGLVVLQVVSNVAALGTGLLADRDLLQRPEMLFLFTCVLAGAILASVIVTMKE